MLVEGTLSVGVLTRQRGRLAEVCYDCSYPHFQEPSQLLLVPAFGLFIAKVEDGVVYRRFAVGAENNVAPIDNLIVKHVLGVEVRELPQTKVKPLILEIRDHLGGVRKACLREFEVAAMGYLEPSSVYVDDIAGYLVLTQLLRDVSNLVF